MVFTQSKHSYKSCLHQILFTLHIPIRNHLIDLILRITKIILILTIFQKVSERPPVRYIISLTKIENNSGASSQTDFHSFFIYFKLIYFCEYLSSNFVLLLVAELFFFWRFSFNYEFDHVLEKKNKKNKKLRS